MKSGQQAGKLDAPVFRCEDRLTTVGEIIQAAHFPGEIEPLWKALLNLVTRETKRASST
jgi:hypothetical protein